MESSFTKNKQTKAQGCSLFFFFIIFVYFCYLLVTITELLKNTELEIDIKI